MKEKELTDDEQAELRKLYQEIRSAKRKLYAPQSYSAQVIGYTLSHIAEKFGKKHANQAVIDLGLRAHGWEVEDEKENEKQKAKK